MKEAMISLIKQIPEGRVVSYGVLAEYVNILTNKTTSGRIIGRLLSGMSKKDRKYETSCPWWRVINKKGFVSSIKLGEKGITQVQLLESEGIVVENNTVDMKVYARRDWQIDDA